LSFSSQFLKQNEITDYLVRVVQPRLSAIEGVQRADILGARTLRHAHLAQGGQDGGTSA
jgi:multidrug efflux pump